MTAALITLLAGLAVAPAPRGMGGAGFDHSRMAAQPLPDRSLPLGTVSVLVRAGRQGVPEAEVMLVPAAMARPGRRPQPGQALVTGRTNTQGRVFLKAAAHAGEQVRAVVLQGQAIRMSSTFAVPRSGGVRLLFLLGGTNGAAPGSPPGRIETTRDPASLALWILFRIPGIEDGKVFVTITYTILNRSPRPFDPGQHGLHLPVPAGARDVAVSPGTRNVIAGKRGLTVHQLVPTGTHGLQVTGTFSLPFHRSVRPVQLHSVLPLLGYTVAIKPYRHVKLAGGGLQKPQQMQEHPGGPATLVFRSVEEGFPSNRIRFDVVGLPVRSRLRSALFVALAVLLILAGFGGLLLLRRRPRGETRRAPRPEAWVDDLVRIERDRILGLLTEADARGHAAAVIEQARAAARR